MSLNKNTAISIVTIGLSLGVINTISNNKNSLGNEISGFKKTTLANENKIIIDTREYVLVNVAEILAKKIILDEMAEKGICEVSEGIKKINEDEIAIVSYACKNNNKGQIKYTSTTNGNVGEVIHSVTAYTHSTIYKMENGATCKDTTLYYGVNNIKYYIYSGNTVNIKGVNNSIEEEIIVDDYTCQNLFNTENV